MGGWFEGGDLVRGLQCRIAEATTIHDRSNISFGSSLVDTAGYNAACSLGPLASRFVCMYGEGDLAGKRGDGDRAEGVHEARGEGQPSFCNLAGILSSGLM